MNVPVYYGKISDAISPVIATVGDVLVKLEENTRESRHAFTNKVVN